MHSVVSQSNISVKRLVQFLLEFSSMSFVSNLDLKKTLSSTMILCYMKSFTISDVEMT